MPRDHGHIQKALRFRGSNDHVQSSALEISPSDFPMPTAISTRAFEMASLFPSYISSGVIGIPSFCAIALTLSVFGLELNPAVSL